MTTDWRLSRLSRLESTPHPQPHELAEIAILRAALSAEAPNRTPAQVAGETLDHVERTGVVAIPRHDATARDR